MIYSQHDDLQRGIKRPDPALDGVKKIDQYCLCRHQVHFQRHQRGWFQLKPDRADKKPDANGQKNAAPAG